MAVLLITKDIIVSASPRHGFSRGQGIVGKIIGKDFDFLTVVTPYQDRELTLPIDCVNVIDSPRALPEPPDGKCPGCDRNHPDPAVWHINGRLLCLDCHNKEYNDSYGDCVRYELDPETNQWVRTSPLASY